MANTTTKRDHIKVYLQNVMQLDAAVKTYQDQKRDFKKNYIDNGWLTKSEMKLIDQSVRMIKQEIDPDALSAISDHVRRELGLESDVENNSANETETDDK